MPRATVGQVTAVTSFIAGTKQGDRLVRVGEVLPASDPVVAAHPELFEPAEAPIETR
jgi:hypothetical protein